MYKKTKTTIHSVEESQNILRKICDDSIQKQTGYLLQGGRGFGSSLIKNILKNVLDSGQYPEIGCPNCSQRLILNNESSITVTSVPDFQKRCMSIKEMDDL